MESERAPEREALRDVHAIRARIAGVPRGHAVLQLAYTVLLAAYMGVFVFTGSTEGGASVLGGATMALLLPPIIISSGLISGANERFRARQRAMTRQWIAVGFFFAALGVILIWGIAGGGYPWWLSLVYAGVTLLIFGIRPFGVLLRAPRSAAEPGSATALSRPVRIVTLLIGAYFGVTCAVVLVPPALSIVMVIGMVATIVALSALTAPWGLVRTGYEWGLAQWAGFGVAATVMFAVAVLVIATDVVTPLVAICAGGVVTASVVISAFARGRTHDTPAS